MSNPTLWHLYARLVAIRAIEKEIDTDVWNSDDALQRTKSYLEVIESECRAALALIVTLAAQRE